MIPAAARRLNSQSIFIALAVSINLLDVWIAGHANSSRAHHIATGAVLDMTVTVPFLYYLLIVRRGKGNLASLGIVTLLSLWRAAFAFPGIVPGKAWIGGAVECIVLAALVVGIRRLRSSGTDCDPASRIEAAVREILPFGFAAKALAGEFTVLYYGFAWGAKPHVHQNSQAFTLHKRSGIDGIFLAVGVGTLLEILPVHMLLAHWSSIAAWIASGLSLYAAFWALAISRSFDLRPALVSSDEILLRTGLIAQLRIPVSAVRAVTKSVPADAVTLPRRTAADLYIEFNRPLELEKPLGMRRTLYGIAVSADDSAAFEEAVILAVANQ